MSKQEEMAAELRTIREELASLKAMVTRPSQRERLREAALADAETPDPRPHALFEDHASRPESIQEQIQRYVRNEMSAYAEEHEFGTFEQEDDFTEDEFDALPNSEFEVPDYELEPDPEMPRIEDADDSRAMPSGVPGSPVAEPPLSDGEAVAGAQAPTTSNPGNPA